MDRAVIVATARTPIGRACRGVINAFVPTLAATPSARLERAGAAWGARW
jgi:hypothetical protein